MIGLKDIQFGSFAKKGQNDIIFSADTFDNLA